ncbi:MAG: NADH-quinone oxidoreductase subunit N [Daejeonella sp.]|uniref:NADH-quinone oxidoreductase subunit N n=1 Tax=Daejeonella sp. TaxID=2805397 RepID=UPI0027353FBF|nr:NADH-quinone oxidoreductase subunit N [Daejeonella sp.]MDP3470196.1 NADH-quinone oxidoreductase subunit N [Daejeonella sp.]
MNDLIPYISSSIRDSLASLNFFRAEISLVMGFLVVILSDLFFSKRYPQLSFILTLSTLVLVAYQSSGFLKMVSTPLFGGMIIMDHLAILFKLLFCLASILFVLFIRFNRAFQNHDKGFGDMYSILLAVHLGLNLMAMSANLLMVYLSLEMVSLGSYLMVGYLSAGQRQTEAAMKYALFGAVCSAIMLYGISLLYGFTGTLYLNDPAFLSGLHNIPRMASALALILVFIGIAFKLSLVPLHFWSPDVYEGAPTPVTAFLSTAPKIAGFAVLIKFLEIFYDPESKALSSSILDLNFVLAFLAILSMLLGNFVAIWQNNVKRMLAYSSIGHTGFMLMGLFIFSASGFKAIIFYMTVYVIMNMAAFLIVDEIEEKTGKQYINEYKGLGKKNSLLMISLLIVLVSLTGLPPTVGFTAKFLVFSTALEAYNLSGLPILMIMIITASLSTIVSLFYYFKVPLNAFLRETSGPVQISTRSPKVYMGVFLAFLLLLLIIFPALLEHII